MKLISFIEKMQSNKKTLKKQLNFLGIFGYLLLKIQLTQLQVLQTNYHFRPINYQQCPYSQFKFKYLIRGSVTNIKMHKQMIAWLQELLLAHLYFIEKTGSKRDE